MAYKTNNHDYDEFCVWYIDESPDESLVSMKDMAYYAWQAARASLSVEQEANPLIADLDDVSIHDAGGCACVCEFRKLDNSPICGTGFVQLASAKSEYCGNRIGDYDYCGHDRACHPSNTVEK